MRKKSVFLLLLALSAAAPLAAQTSTATGTLSLIEAFFPTINPDSNAGRTTFPSLLIPMGGLYEGMGTAFTAVANDSSFIESNPAASSMQGLTEFAFFSNRWVEKTLIYGMVYTMRFDDMGLAFAGKILTIPFTQFGFGETLSTGQYYEITLISNVSYNFFAKFKYDGWDGLALGGSLKLIGRLMPDYADSTGTLKPGSGLAQSGFGAMIDLGLLSRFNAFKFYSSRSKNASVGIALKNFGFPSSGEALPSLLTAGLSYSPIRPLVISVDFDLPFNLLDPSESTLPYWAIGVSGTVTDFLGLQLGLLLEEGKPVITIGAKVDLADLTLVMNWTLDSLTQTGTFGRISFEIKTNLGDAGRLNKQKQVEELYLEGFKHYSDGDLLGAIAIWQQCLAMDPEFDLAKRAIQGAQDELDTQRKIDEAKKINQ
jgi:hypothetical protein